MDRIKNLNTFQKILLGMLTAMIVVFSVLYPVTIGRKGILFHNAILVPSEEDGAIAYRGKIGGKDACFMVQDGCVATWRIGENTYGPYTARLDATAVPSVMEILIELTGVELSCGDEVIFRGGMGEFGTAFVIMDEEGTLWGREIFYAPGAYMYDENGNEIHIDYNEPSPREILEVIYRPEITNKGNAAAWFGGFFISVVSALAILYADELFKWNMSFNIRNAEDAEPSEWAIMSRYISWCFTSVAALVIFMIGLK